jgi:hypothetical protein
MSIRFNQDELKRASEVAQIKDNLERQNVIYNWSKEDGCPYNYVQLLQKVWTIRSGRCTFGKRKQTEKVAVNTPVKVYQVGDIIVDSERREIRGTCTNNNLNFNINGNDFVIHF